MAWTTATTRAAGFSVTAAVWNSEHVDNMNFLKEVNYTAFTGDVTVTQTTVGTAQQIVSSGTITYEAVPHMLEVYFPAVDSGTGQFRLIVRDGTTVLALIARRGASADATELRASYRFTPTAASHTYNVAAWLGAAGTWTVNAGAGGTAGDPGTESAGFMRIFRVPT